MIPFNKPFLTGKEINYIQQAAETGKISGDGKFTKLCHNFFESRYSFNKCLLTSSCTDAIEMAAILMNIKEGDEVILPSFTFVSTANPFVLRGAKLVFCDSCADQPNIDASIIEELITERTRVIVPVHYAGVSCDMDKIMELAIRYDVYVVEDAAQAVESKYKGKALGSIGSLGTISFHETKNVNCGEGGLLIVNDDSLFSRAEIIREKGTNRSAFFRGEIDKYSWVDIGSSFLPSELNAAFLFAQLQQIEIIQKKRLYVWHLYHEGLSNLRQRGFFRTPSIPEYATNNGHIYYLLCNSNRERDDLMDYLKAHGIWAIFHYQSLHRSPYFKELYGGKELPNSDFYSGQLLRLPLFFDLTDQQIIFIIEKIHDFFTVKR